MQKLVDEGADVNAENKNSRTALLGSATNGRAEIVRFLLEKGAEVDARNKYGWTALMVASMGGHIEIVKLLLDKGADVNMTVLQAKTRSRTLCPGPGPRASRQAIRANAQAKARAGDRDSGAWRAKHPGDRAASGVTYGKER